MTTKISVFFLFFTMLAFISCAGVNKSNKKEYANIMLGNVEIKGETEQLNGVKFSAAMNLACKLSAKYNYIPTSVRDSLIKNSNVNVENSILDLAEKADADYITFAQVNTLKNIIRTQITLVETQNPDNKKTGIGYSEIKYISADSGELLYDPALLKSLQRAMADCVNDSNLFVNSSIGLNVKPLPTLVIGSIAYKNESQNEWNLYLDKEIGSFSGVETIFDVIKNTEEYVLYDTETRDSAFKIFGFHIIENYSAPSSSELQTLYKLAVDYYVSGKLILKDESAELEIALYKIEKNGLNLIRKENEFFEDDSRMVFLEYLIRATKRLFNIQAAESTDE